MQGIWTNMTIKIGGMIMEEKELELYHSQVVPVLESKCKEFHLLGYEKATIVDIWACLLHKGREKQLWCLHEVVSMILSLKVTDYMNYLTVQAYQNPHWIFGDGEVPEATLSIDAEELK